jgi:hypothetical protein
MTKDNEPSRAFSRALERGSVVLCLHLGNGVGESSLYNGTGTVKYARSWSDRVDNRSCTYLLHQMGDSLV